MASYSDIVESIVKELIEAKRCVDKGEIAEAVRSTLKISQDAVRALLSRVLRRLAKRDEVYISDRLVCQGLRLDQRILEMLKATNTPKELKIFFTMLMGLVERAVNPTTVLDHRILRYFESVAKPIALSYKNKDIDISIEYEPRDLYDALLALSVFKKIRDAFDVEANPWITRIYLAIPRTYIFDILLAKAYVDTYTKCCFANCPSSTAPEVQNTTSQNEIAEVTVERYYVESQHKKHVLFTRVSNCIKRSLPDHAHEDVLEKCRHSCPQNTSASFEMMSWIWELLHSKEDPGMRLLMLYHYLRILPEKSAQ